MLWWPYRRLLSHRSLLSHSPLLGTTGRLVYLAVLLAGICLLAQPLGAPAPQALARQLAALWAGQRSLLLVAFCGLEASAWLHLIQDGDPMPRLPRPWRRQRRRSRRRGKLR